MIAVQNIYLQIGSIIQIILFYSILEGKCYTLKRRQYFSNIKFQLIIFEYQWDSSVGNVWGLWDWQPHLDYHMIKEKSRPQKVVSWSPHICHDLKKHNHITCKYQNFFKNKSHCYYIIWHLWIIPLECSTSRWSAKQITNGEMNTHLTANNIYISIELKIILWNKSPF